MKPVKTLGLIHLFATLHAVAATLCRLAEVGDELLLTLLTISMIVLICLKRGMNIEFTATCVIVVNVLGYLLGTGAATALDHVVRSPIMVHAISTFLTTEILGWGVTVYTDHFRRTNPDTDDNLTRPEMWTPRVWMLLLAVGVIFVVRLTYIELFTQPYFSSWRLYEIANLLLTNSAAMILLICGNIIFVRYMRREESSSAVRKVILMFLFLLLSTLVVTMVVAWFDAESNGLWENFPQKLSITLLIEAVCYSVIFMVDYAYTSRLAARTERDKRHRAQFRYMTLKQQLNPHFLFNSLNILDCLVLEKNTEQASAYIHKLAGIYRYMLQNEEQTLVRLGEEMAFVGMYIDLLQVRFASGFNVEINIELQAMQRNIVPCSVQLLIENAIKHNVVDETDPLTISITSDGENIRVSNTLRPKLSDPSSTHVGLNYIERQYLDLAARPVEICHTESEYRVTLPLL